MWKHTRRKAHKKSKKVHAGSAILRSANNRVGKDVSGVKESKVIDFEDNGDTPRKMTRATRS